MIEALLGEKYAVYIAASYAITGVVLVALVVWVWATDRARRRDLKALDDAGFGRGGQ